MLDVTIGMAPVAKLSHTLIVSTPLPRGQKIRFYEDGIPRLHLVRTERRVRVEGRGPELFVIFLCTIQDVITQEGDRIVAQKADLFIHAASLPEKDIKQVRLWT
ncbi:hypothetical protein VH569_29635 [Azospirillum sp. 11R-A]|uniref:hypothetical protein n=1 Tax=Azospirillum sp. 11R-A TaxID=3111634 RepID=UPI003C287F99